MADKGFYLPEVLFEMHRVGRSVRVAAIDPITHTEVILVAPAKLSLNDMKRVAARKLVYVMSKKQAAGRKRQESKRIGEDGEKTAFRPLSTPWACPERLWQVGRRIRDMVLMRRPEAISAARFAPPLKRLKTNAF